MKLLSPAGNLECLKMAVFNGADEVYLGVNNFNARNNIDGFSLHNLKEAVEFAHLYNVKVLLAVNILFSNEEMQNAVDLVVDAYNLGVDAFIVQDLGFADIIKKNYPQIELHASTQMGIHNLEGAKQAEKLGFSRVVLARVTPLKEIKRIKENSSVEVEYFAHGALCVSFSGNCFLSSYLCNASGNRGKCKQLCRLPYVLKKDGKELKKGYLLSAKDFYMLDRIEDLKNAGVDVLKIEGRARRPFYVATATKAYRNALDGQSVDKEDLKLAFNRGFSAGYFDGNGNMISNIQNHVGICVGKIEKFLKGKRFNELVFSSNRKLSPKSTFKVFEKGKEKTTFSAYDLKEISKGKYLATTTQIFSVGDEINLIVDASKENEVLKEDKKVSVKIKLHAMIGEKIKAEFEDVVIEGEVCQQAQNQPISKDMMKECFSKHEIFETDLIFEKYDNIFMTKKALNEFRRNVFEKIYGIKTKTDRKHLNKIHLQQVQGEENFACQIVENQNEQLFENNIVYSPECYEVEDIKSFVELCEKKNKKAYLDLPNFALKEDIELLKNIVEETKIGVVANNLYALDFDTEIVVGGGMNVYNLYTAKFLGKPFVCAEGSLSNKIKFPFMTLRHCPMKCLLNAKCNNCPFQKGYTYTMENGKVLKLKRKKLSTCTFYLTE